MSGWAVTQEEHVKREKRYMALTDEIAKLQHDLDVALYQHQNAAVVKIARKLRAKQEQARTLFHQIV